MVEFDSHEAEITGTLFVCGVHRQQSLNTKVHAISSHACKHATDDQGIHIGRSTTNGGSDVEQYQGAVEKPFRIEQSKELTEGQNNRRTAEKKAVVHQQ